MRYWLYSFIMVTLLFFTVLGYSQKKGLPRIAIAGLGIESSTFSPALTGEAAFHAKQGDSVFSFYPFLPAGSALRSRAVWLPALVGKSLPGGAVTREAYESLMRQLLILLKKNVPYDGLFFDIHGAMSVVGLEDPEGDMITRIRKVIGTNTLVSTSMDLHGNVSQRLATQTDLITCYRKAPHEDAMETKERAVTKLLTRIETGKGKPLYKAWIEVPILLPGEKTSTRIEPGKTLYSEVAPAAAQPGVIDAAIWIGYAWADESRNHGVVMVTGDDKTAVTKAAEQLAKSFWNVRNQFVFVAPTASLQESLDKALLSKAQPFFISDSGDNPTAGGAGDVTWSLTEILKRPEFKSADGPVIIYASIPDSAFVQQAITAGIGHSITAPAGARVDARYAPPVQLSGTIKSIEKGDVDAEAEVVVQSGSVYVIVTSRRKPYHKEIDFTRLGLQPRKAAIVVVKIGYLEPELYAMQKGWLLALTPGGVDQNLERLEYRHIHRPMFPFDKNMKEPKLSAVLIERSDTGK
jgi:microcystin degradation protein MlrC